MRVLITTALLLVAFATSAFAEVQTEEVAYEGGGVKMKGMIAWDDSLKGKRPGVLVVHEWWGNNDYPRSRAKQLAALGYVAMAIDMYGDGKVAEHPDNAAAFMQAATENKVQAAERFNAALALLRARKGVDAKNIAAIGYCFGGAVVLNMARAGTDLKGVASFHGALGAWMKPTHGAVHSKVLVMTGAADSMVPEDQVQGFEAEMKEAGADFRVIRYPGAKHAFTNPAADDIARKFSIPVGYDAAADKASWDELQKFLKLVFTPPPEPPARGGYRY